MSQLNVALLNKRVKNLLIVRLSIIFYVAYLKFFHPNQLLRLWC